MLRAQPPTLLPAEARPPPPLEERPSRSTPARTFFGLYVQRVYANPPCDCSAGTLLTYAEVNQTFQVPITQLTQAAGEFATSPIFPNITESQGGNEVGATHTFNLMGLNVSEVLVNVTTNSTSGSAIWNCEPQSHKCVRSLSRAYPKSFQGTTLHPSPLMA